MRAAMRQAPNRATRPAQRPPAIRLVCAAAALLASSLACAAPPPGFEHRVATLRAQAGIPGMAVTIVENDAVTFAKGFGIRALGKPETVDADTLFQTGSTGKAFTVAALGILVDAGKLSWDDKVTDRLPGFQMYDPWVTREMTLRDLLVHRSGLGLGEGDLLFVPRTNLSRAESVRRLRYLKPATSFRSGFAYDNVLYMVAGQLIEAVTGETWEKFTAEHVLRPAGMLHSTTSEEARLATANRAQPHARMNGGLRGAGDQELLDERDGLGRNGAPAGGLAVSANDMARWLLIQLHDGELPEHSGRLFSEAAHREMWTPVVPQPISPQSGVLEADGAKVQRVRTRLGCPGLPGREARVARGCGFRVSHSSGADTGQTRWIRHRDQQRGPRSRPGPDVRAPGSLPGLAEGRLARHLPGGDATQRSPKP